MDNYLLFVIVATITVLSPGPGVVLTLTNAIRYGMAGSFGGILGIACSTFVVAAVSATSLGVLLATSATAFTIMKFIGAAYLIYLGVKLWRAPPVQIAVDTENTQRVANAKAQFVTGFTMQLTNPKAVFFFVSIFPQFVTFNESYSEQFLLLVITYCLLVVVIHLAYAALANTSRLWLASERGGRMVNRIGGGTFLCFGVGLASVSR